MLFEQLLCVMNAGASRCVCGQVKLPSVMDPLQGLRKQPITSEYVYTARISVTQSDTVSIIITIQILRLVSN